MSKRRLLITGADGFIGKSLIAQLTASGRDHVAALRRAAPPTSAHCIEVGNIDDRTDWGAALGGIDCVIHLAARTHVLIDSSPDPLAAYRAINVSGTVNLARQAASTGVRRMIFLSSIKVNGETTLGSPFREEDEPAPEDAYGLTKFEAERALLDISGDTGLEIVILRPPLVYGPGVRGNFLRLMNFVDKNIPLPLSSIKNRRSLIGVNNLASAILTCADSPQAAGNTFLVSDGEDVSTPELVRRLALSMGKTARLFPLSQTMLECAASLLGRQNELARLTGSLQINSSHIRTLLGWKPVYSLDQGLALAAQWYHRSHA